jgi:DNA-binding XRE family transcriptional regulator
LRRRIANPREAAFAASEVKRMEIRIYELEQQLKQYYELINGQPLIDKDSCLRFMSIHQLPDHLIKRRIRSGITQAQLARAIGSTRQVIARYERTRYASVSLKRIIQIDAVLRMFEANKTEIDQFKNEH